MAKPTLSVPQVDLNRIARGQPVAIFTRGFDAYELRGEVTLKGKDDTETTAYVASTEVGRLFNLAQRFVGQSIYAAPAAAATPGYYAPDVALFDALDDPKDLKALHPLTPYTVVLVVAPPQIFPAMAPTG